MMNRRHDEFLTTNFVHKDHHFVPEMIYSFLMTEECLLINAVFISRRAYVRAIYWRPGLLSASKSFMVIGRVQNRRYDDC